MWITKCLESKAIQAEIYQSNQVLGIDLQIDFGQNISLTLKYIQAKVLAENLLAAAQQMQITLDMKEDIVRGSIEITHKTQENKGGQTVCQPNILSVQVEKLSQSKVV
jgi:hypothetical protein